MISKASSQPLKFHKRTKYPSKNDPPHEVNNNHNFQECHNEEKMTVVNTSGLPLSRRTPFSLPIKDNRTTIVKRLNYNDLMIQMNTSRKNEEVINIPESIQNVAILGSKFPISIASPTG